MERDYFMSAEDAVAYRIIDKCSRAAPPDTPPPQAPTPFSHARAGDTAGTPSR